MPNIARESHNISSGPAYVITRAGQTSVYLDGYLVAVADATGATQVSNHPSSHNNIKIDEGSATIFIEDKPVAFAGAGLTCSHTIASTISSTATVD